MSSYSRSLVTSTLGPLESIKGTSQSLPRPLGTQQYALGAAQEKITHGPPLLSRLLLQLAVHGSGNIERSSDTVLLTHP